MTERSAQHTVHIVGRRSYIGSILAAHLRELFEVRPTRLDALSAADVRKGDVIVNCAFSAAHYNEPVSEDLGTDGVAAAIACETGARFVMPSTRAVYGPRVAPPLKECEPLAAVSIYGRNKVAIEAGLHRMLGENLLILRIGNVFGGEPPGRRTFVSTAIESIIQRGSVELQMSPATRKDFIPAEFLGSAAAALISSGATGIFNVGSGIALPVGAVADALIAGFGGGEVRVTDPEIGEEFLLDIAKLRSHTGLSITEETLLSKLEDTARAYRQ